VKTISLKKVSAVAVASLGFGLLSVVPANAAASTAWTVYDNNITSFNLTKATTTPTTGSDVYVNVGAVVGAGTAQGSTTTASVTQIRGVLTSYPACGYAAAASSTNVAGATAGTATAVTGYTTAVVATGITGASGTNSIFLKETDATAAGSTVTSTSTAGIASFKFNPTKAGVYTLTVWNDSSADGATTVGNNIIDSDEARQTIDLTVVAPSGYSSALSTAFIAQDIVDADDTIVATATTNATDKPVAIKTLGQKVAQIVIVTRDTDNAILTGYAVTASVSGAGFVTAGSTTATAGAPTAAQADAADGTASTTRTASVTAAANTTGVVTVGVWGDGTSGTGTIKIEVTDSVTGATTTLATKTVTFHGTVATLTATTLQGIATPGVANGCSNVSTCTQATLALTPAVVIVAKDSAGVVVPALTITGTPTDTAVISGTSVAAVSASTDFNGRGYYNASITGGSSANVGKKSVITWSTTLADGVTKITTTSEASLGGTPASVVWSFDKTSYSAGAPIVITVTAKDAAGNAVGDNTYANLFAGASTLGGSFTGSTPAASVELVGGKATFTAFAPGNGGTYTIKNTYGASAGALVGTAVTSTVTVVDGNAALLTQIDALNAKIVALNALIAKIMKKLGVK
jgi:hypothetical protein